MQLKALRETAGFTQEELATIAGLSVHAVSPLILGVRDAVVERTSITIVDDSVHALRARTEQDARVRLGPERWALAYAAGRKTSIESLIQDIENVLAKR